MKLSKFKHQKMNVSELQKVKGGKEIAAGYTTSAGYSTSCTGSDHDHSPSDSD
jgi:hypothetical protein